MSDEYERIRAEREHARFVERWRQAIAEAKRTPNAEQVASGNAEPCADCPPPETLTPVNAAVATVATYPAAHFERWESDKPVPLQVTPDGRVWGHVAGDGCFRGGNPNECKLYRPDPDPMLRNFHVATAALDTGEVIRVGSITAGYGGHASPTMSLDQQRQHHENANYVFARVRAFNDRHGRLAVAGSVIPGLPETAAAQCAGTPASIELWPAPGINGLTLSGIQLVNMPAWPVL